MIQNEPKDLAKIKLTGTHHTGLPNASAYSDEPPLILAFQHTVHVTPASKISHEKTLKK